MNKEILRGVLDTAIHPWELFQNKFSTLEFRPPGVESSARPLFDRGPLRRARRRRRRRPAASRTRPPSSPARPSREVQHVDETGWKIGGRSAWLWVFADEHATLYRIRKSRGHEVVVEVLGEDYQGVLVSDCFLAYDPLNFAKSKLRTDNASFSPEGRSSATASPR